ncbi:hypothetical protein AAHC03_010073 [Spirometra sp. Aus1]
MLLDSSRENQFIQPIKTAQEGSGSVVLSGTCRISNALIILDFHNYTRIPMRSFIDVNLAEETYGLTSPSGEILLYNATEGEVRKYLKDHFAPDYVDVSVATEPITSTPVSTAAPKVTPPELLPVYAADIVASLRHVLFNDVGMKSVITGEDLDALKEFIEAVRRFLVLDSHYNFSIDSIKNQLSGQTSVSADQWNAILAKSGVSATFLKVTWTASAQRFCLNVIKALV